MCIRDRLKKEGAQYEFFKNYEIDPAHFNIISESNKVLISCQSKTMNGYAYLLKKAIELHESGFSIQYYIENTGEKDIVTDEYNHNFTAINKDLIGTNYVLKLPFQLTPQLFTEVVNPEGKVDIGQNEITFKGTPKEQFFYSNLTGSENVKATWELINLESNIAMSESGSFQTNKVNLWGWQHVISPELFFNIFLKPGRSIEWSRNYNVYSVK
jgi:hypothetical protein